MTDKIDGNVALADRKNMLYSGSSVVYGRGEGVVVATGMNTEIGKIAALLSNTKEELTPLQKKMNEISRILTWVVVAIGMIMVLLGLVQGTPWLEIFILAVSLAVAAIPEGMVAAITIVLSIGVQNMAKKNSIIRKMSSVETLGATEIICSDKTGTLTQNKMTVTNVSVNLKEYNLDNIASSNIKESGEFSRIIECMVLCNDMKETDEIGDKKYLGDPTEIALGVFAEKLNYSIYDIEAEHERVAELPFDSERKMMTTINRKGNLEAGFIANVKGALESVLPRCTKIMLDGTVVDLTEKMRAKILDLNLSMTNKALRVLAFACKECNVISENMNGEEIENELVFIGLTGMIDPPRVEVKDAVKKCKQAGMIPVMITGDNIQTAVAIATDIGIMEKGHIAITGKELDELSDEEFKEKIQTIRVYARVSPENKVRIVDMWETLGKTVAMTGDGVNDAPALKAADIGVGMGITGTEVSKNVASMILTDDNFASIVTAVEEGRRIYNNIQNVIAYLLASNIAEVIIVFIATLFGKTIFTPLQLLWINLISDTVPAITLGFEKAHKNIMMEKPRSNNEKFFNPFLVTRIVVPAIIKSIIILSLYMYFEYTISHVVAVTISFITLVFIELLFAEVARSDRESILKIGICSNPQMLLGILGSILLQCLVMFIKPVQEIFNIVNLSMGQYVVAFLAPFVFVILAELAKHIIAKVFKKAEVL